MNEHKPELPNAWTDLSQGITRQQLQNVLTVRYPITIYFDGEPVGVLVPVTGKYQMFLEQLTDRLTS